VKKIEKGWEKPNKKGKDNKKLKQKPQKGE
jgi:hypothetical protein